MAVTINLTGLQQVVAKQLASGIDQVKTEQAIHQARLDACAPKLAAAQADHLAQLTTVLRSAGLITALQSVTACAFDANGNPTSITVQ